MHTTAVASRPALLQAACADPRRHAIVVVLVDAGHVMRVRRIVLRCDGVDSVRVTPLGRHTQVRVDVRCEAAHAAQIVAKLDACVRSGDIGRLSHFVVDMIAPRS